MTLVYPDGILARCIAGYEATYKMDLSTYVKRALEVFIPSIYIHCYIYDTYYHIFKEHHKTGAIKELVDSVDFLTCDIFTTWGVIASGRTQGRTFLVLMTSMFSAAYRSKGLTMVVMAMRTVLRSSVPVFRVIASIGDATMGESNCVPWVSRRQGMAAVSLWVVPRNVVLYIGSWPLLTKTARQAASRRIIVRQTVYLSLNGWIFSETV